MHTKWQMYLWELGWRLRRRFRIARPTHPTIYGVSGLTPAGVARWVDPDWGLEHY